ncbi:MAG: hypothetical protein K5924_02765 [Chloroflexi bacterium]|nr:hypothetical protein [Chloroflexota bacterium]
MTRPTLPASLALLTVLAVTACTATAASPAPRSSATSVPSAPSEPMPEPVNAWTLRGTGRAAAGNADLTLEGGHEPSTESVAFDGVSGWGGTSDPGPVNTMASFSVAAWVSLAEQRDFAVAISQQGDVAGAFFLGVAEGKWDFTMKDADSNEPGHSIRAAAAVAQPGPEWVHLAGVYDDAEGEIRLYVNGEPAASVPFAATWQAEGPLTVAVAQAHSVQADFWPGAISDVRVYDVALTDGAAAAVFADDGPTSSPPPLPAPPTDEVSIFRALRNEICTAGSADVAAVNATMETGPVDATPAGLRQVAELILRAQAQLDQLAVPAALAEFVAADNAYRADRIRLVNELADALERNDVDAADAIDRELTTNNIDTEAEEVARRLVECP